MGVDEYIRALHLLQELMKSVHVVAGYQDAVALDCASSHLGRRRLAEGIDMGLLEQLHGLDIHLTSFYRQVQELLGVEVHIGECREESPLYECVHLRIGIAQLPGVVEIGAYALDGKEQVVLQPCHCSFLSTYSLDGAACAPCSLGALIAEHVQLFFCSHLIVLQFQ